MKRRIDHRSPRRGNVIVLTACMMIVLVACVAFSVDSGYILVARAELQRTADTAAMAAAWDLIDDEALSGDSTMTDASANARESAQQFAALNLVCAEAPSID